MPERENAVFFWYRTCPEEPFGSEVQGAQLRAVGRSWKCAEEADLLRLTISEQGNGMVLRLEGRLVGPWTSVVERCWRDAAARTAKLIVIDLNAVTFIDASGKALLGEMHDSGALLQARAPLNAYIVEQIRTNSTFMAPGYEA